MLLTHIYFTVDFCRNVCGENSICLGVLDPSTTYNCSCDTGYYRSGKLCLLQPSSTSLSTVASSTKTTTVKTPSTTTKTTKTGLTSTIETVKTGTTAAPSLSLSPTLTTITDQSSPSGLCDCCAVFSLFLIQGISASSIGPLIGGVVGGIIAVIALIVLIICIRRRKNAVSAQKQGQVGEHPLFTVKRPGHSWSSRDYEMPGAQANRWNDDAYDITSKTPAPVSDHQYSEISSSSHYYQAPHGTTDPHKGHKKGTSSIGHVYLEPSAAQMAEYDKAKASVTTTAPLGFGLSSGQLTTTSTTSAPSSHRGD